jgi:carbonic anhydrase
VRKISLLVAGIALCILVLAVVVFGQRQSGADVRTGRPSPGEALRMLQEGNERFYSGKAVHPHADAARLRLAGKADQGDYAYATVLACSDSRVPVELVFDAGVMDLFVVRVAGNVCDTDEIGTIEYGMKHVNTPVLVVLGHSKCGAVTTATHRLHGEQHALERSIPPLIDNIIPAVEHVTEQHPEVHGDAIIPYAIEQNVWQAIEDLFMRSPAARDAVSEGTARVVGAIYDVGSGEIDWLPLEKVDGILRKVESSPEKETEEFAAR